MRSRSEGAVAQLIGKIISGVVLTHNPAGHPRSQVFITFSDGTAFEFWADDEMLCTATGLDHHRLDDIVAIHTRREGTIIKAFRPAHEDLDNPQADFLTPNL